MRVLLPKDLAEIVRKKIATDRYEDAVDVLHEALHLLDAYEEHKLANLRKIVERAEKSGPAEPFDMQKFIEDLHAQDEDENPRA